MKTRTIFALEGYYQRSLNSVNVVKKSNMVIDRLCKAWSSELFLIHRTAAFAFQQTCFGKAVMYGYPKSMICVADREIRVLWYCW
jgi:hypothetical protein